MSRISSLLLAAVLGVSATAVCAHPRLQTSNPAAGAKLSVSPKEIRMTFSEGLVAPFTGLELRNGSGKTIPTGNLAFLAGDTKKIAVPIGARLAPGTYTVTWHAVSVDTHRVTGTYMFKVVR